MKARIPGCTVLHGREDVSPGSAHLYAAALKDSANPKGAAAFVDWLRSKEDTGFFLQNRFDAPRDAAVFAA